MAMITKFGIVLRTAVGLLIGAAAWGEAFSQIPPSSVGRVLAPDALYIIPPSMEYSETFLGPIDLPVVLQRPEIQWQPNESPESDTLYQRARGITFNLPIHCLEFAFKPVRTIDINLPTSDGVEKTRVWYLVYRVRYLGGDFRPAVEKGERDSGYFTDIYGTPEPVSFNWVRFMPNFHLQTKGKVQQILLDEVIPEALVAIEQREQIGQPLHDSISIQRTKLTAAGPASDEATWGVALWTGVDPATSFFSVEVSGLTNAQQLIQDGKELYFPQKTLVLNFFRPGGDNVGVENTIRFGVPAVNRVDGLQSELQKAIVANEYEMSIVGGLSPEVKLSQSVRDIAQIISGLGAQQIRPYIQSGSLLFTLAQPDQERTLEDAVLRQLGIQTQVLSRTIPLSNIIRELSKSYERSFRQQLVGLVGEGASIREVSGRFGCSMQTIATWVRDALPAVNEELDSVSGQAVYELIVAGDRRDVDNAALAKELTQILAKLDLPQQVTLTDRGGFRFSLSSARLATFIENVILERLELTTEISRIDEKLNRKVNQLQRALAQWQSESSVRADALERLNQGGGVEEVAKQMGVRPQTLSSWLVNSRLRRRPVEPLSATFGDPEISIEKDLQTYILEQFGIAERLDYFWAYR